MNILVTGAWQQASEYMDMIRKQHEPVFLQNEQETLPRPPEWVEGIIGNGIFLYHPIEQFTNLRYIQLTSAGYDRVPTDYIKEHGITIRNARGVYSIPMAEFAIAGVLHFYKDLGRFGEKQAMKIWEKERGLLELCGKTVLIVGCGSVGTACAKRFHAFGTKVVGLDQYPGSVEDVEPFLMVMPVSELKAVVPKADIIVLTVPLSEETRGLIGRDELALCRDGAIIVNIARGGVIDEEELIKVLKTRPIGAVLDVFENEPLPEDSPLWKMENVIITPHNSFVGDGNGKRLSRLILHNLQEAEEKCSIRC